jgi:hypothetical protein
MNKVFDILPSLTPAQKEKKANGAKVIDNFTVKKCPLMDNFENMDPTTMWKPLVGAPIQLDTKQNSVNAKILAHSSENKDIKESMFVLTDSSNNVVDSSNNVVKPTLKNVLPKIQGITHAQDTDSDDDDESVMQNMIKLDNVSKVYVGALSIVGLFVLYRVVKKTI